MKKGSTKKDLKAKIRDVKLVKSIVLLLIIAVVSSLIISGVGYLTMDTINDNTNSLYSNRLLPIVKIGEIENYFYTIKYNISKGIENQLYYEYDEKIKSNHKKLQNLIDEFEALDLDENEARYLKMLREDYKLYLDEWEKVKETLSKDGKANSTQVRNVASLESSIDNHLNGLVKYNRTKAEETKTMSHNIYRENVIIFFILSGVSIITLIIVAVVIIQTIKYSIKDIEDRLTTISKGDFTVDIYAINNSEFGIMKKALYRLIIDISGMLGLVKTNSLEVAKCSNTLSQVSLAMSSSSREVSSAVEEVSIGASNQAQELKYINNSVVSFGDEVENVVTAIEEINDIAKSTDGLAKMGNEKLGILVKSIEDISNSFREISTKINALSNNMQEIGTSTKLINEISDQTNLLALNASIEAARAGEAGKGFAVVANEIRMLAEGSKDASKRINSMIAKITDDVFSVIETTNTVNVDLTNQSDKVNNTIMYVKEIIASIEQIIPKFGEVRNSLIIINEEKDTIIDKINTVSEVANGASATAEQITASAQELNAATEEVAQTAIKLEEMTNKMNGEINKFKL